MTYTWTEGFSSWVLPDRWAVRKRINPDKINQYKYFINFIICRRIMAIIYKIISGF